MIDAAKYMEIMRAEEEPSTHWLAGQCNCRSQMRGVAPLARLTLSRSKAESSNENKLSHGSRLRKSDRQGNASRRWRVAPLTMN